MRYWWGICLVAVVGCAGPATVTRVVRVTGAAPKVFTLWEQDAQIADQYLAQQPKSEEYAEQCKYWQRAKRGRIADLSRTDSRALACFFDYMTGHWCRLPRLPGFGCDR